MKILTMLLILAFNMIGCSHHPKSTNEMEKRSQRGLEKTKRKSLVRKKERVELVHLGGRFLETGDRFYGGDVDLLVEEPEWLLGNSKKKRKGAKNGK